MSKTKAYTKEQFADVLMMTVEAYKELVTNTAFPDFGGNRDNYDRMAIEFRNFLVLVAMKKVGFFPFSMNPTHLYKELIDRIRYSDFSPTNKNLKKVIGELFVIYKFIYDNEEKILREFGKLQKKWRYVGL